LSLNKIVLYLYLFHVRYSWCSDYVVEDKFRWASKGITLDDLIPLETEPQSAPLRTGPQRLVIGHNVAFDRSFVKEQYFVQVITLLAKNVGALNFSLA